jgi:hypothetical protein
MDDDERLTTLGERVGQHRAVREALAQAAQQAAFSQFVKTTTDAAAGQAEAGTPQGGPWPTEAAQERPRSQRRPHDEVDVAHALAWWELGWNRATSGRPWRAYYLDAVAALAPGLAGYDTLDGLLTAWYGWVLLAEVTRVCQQAPTATPLDDMTVLAAAYWARWREIQAEEQQQPNRTNCTDGAAGGGQ